MRAPKLDGRYTFAREWCGQRRPRWVARFCGAWVGQGGTRRAARRLGTTHRRAWLAAVAALALVGCGDGADLDEAWTLVTTGTWVVSCTSPEGEPLIAMTMRFPNGDSAEITFDREVADCTIDQTER